MRNLAELVEMVIEQEAERLDAAIEGTLFEAQAYPWTPIHDRINPRTHSFSPRGVNRRRIAARSAVSPRTASARYDN
jgi:hypothetical protein